jgi:hypothetical protein
MTNFDMGEALVVQYSKLDKPKEFPSNYLQCNETWYRVLDGRGRTSLVSQDASIVNNVVYGHDPATLPRFDTRKEVVAILFAYQNIFDQFHMH